MQQQQQQPQTVEPHCIAAETRRCDCGFEAPTGKEVCPVYGLPAFACLIACDIKRLPPQFDEGEDDETAA